MLSTSTRRSTPSRLAAAALLMRAGVALAAFASLLFAAGARAEPTGFASDESTFTFSASCASGADRCFWPMTRLDDIYYGREPRCDEWEVASDGRRCKVYNEKATHGADPQALVAN